MQGARHVDAGGIIVETREPHIARREICPDVLEEIAELHAAPLADLAPSLDADVPGDLASLGQGAKPVDRPRRLVGDQPGRREPPIVRNLANLVFLVIRIEAERVGDGARRVGIGQPGAGEQGRLHAVVEPQHRPQCPVHAGVGGQVATREQAEAAERQSAQQHVAPPEPGQLGADFVGRDDRFRTVWRHGVETSGSAGTPDTMDTIVRGYISASATCSTTKAAIASIAARWMPRATG